MMMAMTARFITENMMIDMIIPKIHDMELKEIVIMMNEIGNIVDILGIALFMWNRWNIRLT